MVKFESHRGAETCRAIRMYVKWPVDSATGVADTNDLELIEVQHTRTPKASGVV